jgi:C_GCAxxG_C_C family probable redox protein
MYVIPIKDGKTSIFVNRCIKISKVFRSLINYLHNCFIRIFGEIEKAGKIFSYMNKRSKIGLEMFEKGYNCAQSVVYAFSDLLPVEKNCVLKISSGFGAGMGRNQEVCGAVSGGIMVIGMHYGRGELDDPEYKEIAYRKTKDAMDLFKKTHGSWNCKELLKGCDLNTEEGKREFKENSYHSTVCNKCVETMISIVEKML